MKPSAITDCLNRCLALRPLTGWPEWAIANHGNSTYRLQGDDELWARYAAESDSTGRCRAYRLQQILGSHEALCIWQDHLLRRLGERAGKTSIVYFDYRYTHCTGLPQWNIKLEDRDCFAYIEATRPTLIEALLDVCEQIMKETGDA